MKNETRKIRFLISRGSPLDGVIIRRGTEIEFPLFWASIFIKDGTAELVEETKPAEPRVKKHEKS